jgi:hypothetical protein
VTFAIATATRDDVDFCVEQAANEGWNPGLHDAAAFHATDPEGFLIARLDGAPIGCISAVRYPERFGFVGFYIVVPERRGKGYGIRLWQAAMARLAGCNVALDGVLAQQDNYRKSGFELAYSNIRFERERSRTSHRRSDDARQASDPGRELGLAPDRGVDVRPLAAIPFAHLAAYDRTAFPAPRPAFLDAWMRLPASHALAVADARDAGALRGYGVVRRCRRGWKIGPLFAETPPVAHALFAALSDEVPPGEPVYLDVPEINADALALAARHGMREVFRTARMYTGGRPALRDERVYGVSTFELG